MSVAYAFDGASPFDLPAAKAAGAIAITGYVIGHPGGFDPITKARVDEIHALELGFIPNAEWAANFFASCSLDDAQRMGSEAAAACRALGVPANNTVAIPASFDYDMQGNFGSPYRRLLAFGLGAAGYLPRAYGPLGFLQYITQPGRMPGTKHWLMMSTFGAGYNVNDPSVCMVQEHDAAGNWLTSPVPGTDINTITDPHALCAWWPTGSPYSTGDDMTPAESQMLKDIHDRLGKLDTEAYEVDKQIAPAVAAIREMVSALHPSATPAVIAAAVVAALPPGGAASGLSVSDVEQAVKTVLGGSKITTAP